MNVDFSLNAGEIIYVLVGQTPIFWDEDTGSGGYSGGNGDESGGDSYNSGSNQSNVIGAASLDDNVSIIIEKR